MNKTVVKFLIPLLLLVYACSPKGIVSYRNMAGMYDVYKKPAAPNILVFNSSQDSVEIYMQFLKRDFVFATIPGNPPQAWLKVSCHVISDFESKAYIDSTVFEIGPLTQDILQDTLVFKRRILAPAGSVYSLIFRVHDLILHKNSLIVKNINRLAFPGFDDFLCLSADSAPVFESQLNVGNPYRFKSSFTNQHNVYVRKLMIETGFPEPAFAQSDTGFYEVKYATGTDVGPSGLFTPESAGRYLVTNQLTGELGRVIDVAPGKAEFPLNSEEMASAMRYITSEDEFNTIMRSQDMKTAVDSFWIAVAGNPQRAMLLIKNYFSRVAESSKLFSTAIPGWKTDRGMIYIVWGKPNLVYRNKDTETWIYSERDDSQVMNFDFKLSTDRFGLPEYRLGRSLIYREVWYNAIESLRR